MLAADCNNSSSVYSSPPSLQLLCLQKFLSQICFPCTCECPMAFCFLRSCSPPWKLQHVRQLCVVVKNLSSPWFEANLFLIFAKSCNSESQLWLWVVFLGSVLTLMPHNLIGVLLVKVLIDRDTCSSGLLLIFEICRLLICMFSWVREFYSD